MAASKWQYQWHHESAMKSAAAAWRNNGISVMRIWRNNKRHVMAKAVSENNESSVMKNKIWHRRQQPRAKYHGMAAAWRKRKLMA
jgi:hypothetical protein